jgi:hypothetical protein
VIEGKLKAASKNGAFCAFCAHFFKLRNRAEAYTSTAEFSPLIKDKKHARHPLIALIAQIFRGPESPITGTTRRTWFAYFAHFYKETKTRRASKRKRSAANAPKMPKKIEFYLILQKSKIEWSKRDRHLGKRSLLQTTGKLGISIAVCWGEYFERGARHWPERVSYPTHEQVYWCAWRPNQKT